MGAVLIEESHQRQSGRALFSPKTFKEFMTPEVIKTLIEIANGHHPLSPKGNFTH